jgi:hypothetical protein
VALIGMDGPGVVLSPETAFILEKTCRVHEVRARLRGRHPKVGEELLDLKRVADLHEARQRVPRVPELQADPPELGRASQVWFSSVQAADLLGVTERAVTKACLLGRLEAEQVAGRWRITRDAIDTYRTTRRSGR